VHGVLVFVIMMVNMAQRQWFPVPGATAKAQDGPDSRLLFRDWH
jgi:hypothetical protein